MGAGWGRGAALAGLAALTALASAACGRDTGAPRRPRLVVLYATCTLAKDVLEPYEPAVTWTPRLAAFARRGVVFARHQTESGLSGVAFASLFSGTWADRHGVYTHPTPLRDDVPLVTQAFADAGFDVWFWGDHEMASPALGYARGTPPEHVIAGRGRFAAPDPRRRRPEREAFLRAEDPRFERLLDGLRDHPERRALVVTNFTVTHAPYSIAWLDDLCRDDPGACAGRPERLEETAELFWRHYVDLSWNFDATVRRLGLSDDDVARLASVAELLYRANVHRLDGLFGDVLDAIDRRGLRDESVVAFTADHGEVRYREGAILHWNHGFALAPEVLSVPWLLAAPGLAPAAPGAGGRNAGGGRVWQGVTRSIDVFPTLAGLAGVPVPEGVEGVDLSPALRGEAPPPVLEAFSHTALVPDVLLRASRARGGTRLDALHPDADPDGIWVALRDGDRLYERVRPGGAAAGFERRVLDLASAPGDPRDLYDADDPAQARRFESLERRRSALVAGLRAVSGVPAPLPEGRKLDMLRRLGYVE